MTDVVGRGVLLVETDATGVSAGMAQATKAVDKFEKSAVGAANKVGDAMSKAGADTNTAAGQMDAATKRFLSSLEREAVTLEKGRVGWLEYKAAKMGASQESAALIARMRAAENQVGNLGMSAKQTTAAMRMLPAQITDIVTGLASGQPAYLVAIQQGGQLKDSFGGVVPAAKALASVFTPLRVAIGGGVGAAIALAAAYNQGSKEADAYNKALVMTGNAAGTTAGQLQLMAQNISASVGTQGGAAEVLAALASSGQVAGGNLERVGETIVKMTRTMGVEAQEAVKQFAELGKSPVQASEKLNEQYRYLTVEIYNQITALMEQGRQADAAALAQQAFADATDARIKKIEESLGWLELGWRNVGEAAGWAWDRMKDIGRPDTVEEKLSRAQKDLADLVNQQQNGWGFTFGIDGAVEKQREVVRLAQLAVTQSQLQAKADKEYLDRQQAGINAQKKFNELLDQSRSKAQQLDDALKAQDKRNADIVASGGTVDMEQDRQIRAHLRKQFSERGRGFRDDAATRMLQQLRETEATLKSQLDGESKLGAAAKARIEFEQQIVDLKTKGTLTAEQKSLLANEQSIRTQLEKNEALEKEIGIRDLIAKKTEEQAKKEQRFLEQAAGIMDGLAGARESRREQADRQLAAFGLGDRAQAEIAAQAAIFREHERARARLARDASENGTLDSEKYRLEVDKIKASLSLSLAEHAAYFARLRELQGNWRLGASQAIQNYIDEAENAAAQANRAISDGLHILEDGFSDVMDRNYDSFRDLIDSMERDFMAVINRMVAKALTAELAKSLGLDKMGGAGGGGGGPLGQLFGMLAGGMGGGSAIGYGSAGTAAGTAFVSDGAGNLVAALAKGGLVGPSGIDMFANGGIVTEPTMFGHGGGLGQMGEAGYEAVMPVARGADGKLGVKAQGGGRVVHNTTVNVYPKDYESFRRSDGQLKAQVNGWSAGGRRFQ